MRILRHLLFTLLALIILYLLTRNFQHSHEEYYESSDSFIYSKGNAPDSVRVEIIQLLYAFQEGYTKRDTSLVETFMQQLFTEDNVLILGTMPNEICIGTKEAKRLVHSDWEGWGDCSFMMDIASVSAYGNTAWISTIGFVKFDMSRFLVLPLRLSAVIIKENNLWKFQQVQFQFDLDLTFLLVTIIITILWSAVSLVMLAVVIIQAMKKPESNKTVVN